MTLYNVGKTLAGERKHKDAYPYLKRAVTIWEKTLPSTHPYLAKHGIPLFIKVATKAGKKAEAKKYTDRLKDIAKQQAVATKQKAITALKSNASAEQLNSLAWSLVDPDRGDKDTDVALALKLVQKAVKAEPNNSAYHDTLAWALFANKKYKEAIQASKRALKLAPEEQKKDFQGYLKKLKAQVAKKRK